MADPAVESEVWMKKTDYRAELKKEYERWNELFTHGGQDPFYTDGTNLELVRNHIMFCKKSLEQEGGDMPEEYSWPLPPEVPQDYMARTQEIWYHGIESYQRYMEDENYQYLKEISETLPEKIKEETRLKTVLEYTGTIRRALEQRDYVTLRRHEHPERYLESFAKCRRQVEEMLRREREKSEMPQEQKKAEKQQEQEKAQEREKAHKPREQKENLETAGTNKKNGNGQLNLFQMVLRMSR